MNRLRGACCAADLVDKLAAPAAATATTTAVGADLTATAAVSANLPAAATGAATVSVNLSAAAAVGANLPAATSRGAARAHHRIAVASARRRGAKPRGGGRTAAPASAGR